MPNEVLSFATFVKLLRSYKTRTEQEISDVLDSDASLNPVLDWKQVLMTASLQKNATIFLAPLFPSEAWNHSFRKSDQMETMRQWLNLAWYRTLLQICLF